MELASLPYFLHDFWRKIFHLLHPIIPNLGGGYPSPCWFSLNNLETAKAVTLAFSSIQ